MKCCIGQRLLRVLVLPRTVSIQHQTRARQRFPTVWILEKDLIKSSGQPFVCTMFNLLFRVLFFLCPSFAARFFHLSSSFFFFSLLQSFFPVAFPLLVFTYLGLGLSCSPCQAAGSCCSKSVLPESMAPLSHSQEVQIQWGKLSIATHRQSGRVARRLQQLKFKWVQIFFFLALICSEFMLNSFEYGISYLFSSSSLLPSLQLCLCLSVFVQSVPCLWFPTFEGFWFAVFVRGEALCFVGALRFPLAAVKVSQRFSLCESGRGN